MDLTLNSLKKATTQAALPKTGFIRIWDKEVPSFHVRIYSTGRKSFRYSYWFEGTKKDYNIGPNLNLHDARRIALELASLVAQGKDPQAEKMSRQIQDVTFREVAARYLNEYVKVINSGKTFKEYERYMAYLMPQIGDLRINTIEDKHISKIQANAKEKKGVRTSNVIIGMLKKMFRLAVEKWGLLETDPCHKVKKYKEHPRVQYLSHEELNKLMESIRKEPNLTIGTFFMVLIHTAARRGELVNMKWEHLDLEKQIWFKPMTKSGESHQIPLNGIALSAINGLHRIHGNPYVFAGEAKGKPLNGFSRFWKRILTRAGMQGFHIHDIRRSVGSLLLQNGTSIEFISQILGHKSIGTTERVYAKLNLAVKTQTINKLGDLLASKP